MRIASLVFNIIQSPSVYSQNRQKALQYVIEQLTQQRCDCEEKFNFALFGDFNFRLDLGPLIEVRHLSSISTRIAYLNFYFNKSYTSKSNSSGVPVDNKIIFKDLNEKVNFFKDLFLFIYLNNNVSGSVCGGRKKIQMEQQHCNRT